MEGFLDKVVFVKRGINSEAECTAESMKQVGLCVADTYAMLVNSPDFSENKISITKIQPQSGSKFLRLKIASKGIDVPIICWEPYQSHSIINV